MAKLQRTLLMKEKSQLHQRPERIVAEIRKDFKILRAGPNDGN